MAENDIIRRAGKAFRLVPGADFSNPTNLMNTVGRELFDEANAILARDLKDYSVEAFLSVAIVAKGRATATADTSNPEA